MIRSPNEVFLRSGAVGFGLSARMLLQGMEATYDTIDAIDSTLLKRGGLRLANVIELANLSSVIGNLLAQGIVDASEGVFSRAGAHKYQDLRGARAGAANIEIKMALEKNRPKGHLPKAGHYLTCRYVLCADDGTFSKGKEARGRIPRIWELRLGLLSTADFSESNTEGDSGKTAIVTLEGMKKLALVYCDHELIPFASATRYLDEYGK